MKTLVAMVMAATLAGPACAATLPGSISREPLVKGRVSDRISVGLGYDRIQRGITFKDGGSDVLEADSMAGYLGYNVLPWLTSFVTAGGTSLRGSQWIESEHALRLSAGLSAYLWDGDVLTPAFAAGRISFKGSLELARHQADTRTGTSEWFELVATLPVGYEFFDRYPAPRSGYSPSLALYAGPAVSILSGDLQVAPGFKREFEESRAFGAVAGADVYLAPVFSIGFKVLILDEVSSGASLRFHF
jgi:hypothetical protein